MHRDKIGMQNNPDKSGSKATLGGILGRHKTCPYILVESCRGNPCGCPAVGRLSKIDSAVSRFISRHPDVNRT